MFGRAIAPYIDCAYIGIILCNRLTGFSYHTQGGRTYARKQVLRETERECEWIGHSSHEYSICSLICRWIIFMCVYLSRMHVCKLLCTIQACNNEGLPWEFVFFLSNCFLINLLICMTNDRFGISYPNYKLLGLQNMCMAENINNA